MESACVGVLSIMEQSVSETSAYKIQTPINYTEESTQHCNSSFKFQMHRKTFNSLAFTTTGSKTCLASELTVQRVLC